MVKAKSITAAVAVLGAVILIAGCSALTIEKQFDDKNAENIPGVVFIDPEIPYVTAVWSQETYEAEHKANPAYNVLVRADTSFRRDMEATSHMIEAIVAALLYGADEKAYIVKEANDLRTSYGDLFKGSTNARIVERMEGRRPVAQRWVEKNLSKIRRQYRKFHGG